MSVSENDIVTWEVVGKVMGGALMPRLPVEHDSRGRQNKMPRIAERNEFGWDIGSLDQKRKS